MYCRYNALCFIRGKKYPCFIRLRHTLIESKLNEGKRSIPSAFSAINQEFENPKLPNLDEEFKRRIFNTKLWKDDPTVSYVRRRALLRQIRKQNIESGPHVASRSICVKLLEEETKSASVDVEKDDVQKAEQEIVSYPYSPVKENSEIGKSQRSLRGSRAVRLRAEKAIQKKAAALRSWLSDYDVYDEKTRQNERNTEDETSNTLSWEINYGTADRGIPISKVPCGGCGAVLHCQEPSIPGYLPKEIFSSRTNRELQSLICQRCHFLKEYNVALGVNVSPEEYPKILSQIEHKRGIVVLLVDLLDFPCSIWPGIMDIIGTRRPVVIVGNKIDLIPGDHTNYLQHIIHTLQINVEQLGIAKANIKFTSLISARTGFGVEDLITRLHQLLWDNKSDIYLIGCTNVGKSTLFNTLIQSDFCKVKAVDIVQRATTSVWPGTTLNLLKFPILRPEGWKLFERQKRLDCANRALAMEKKILSEQIKRRHMYHMPSFYQFVGRTFSPFAGLPDENSSVFGISTRAPKAADTLPTVGIDVTDPEFSLGRWCYDTPGVVHPNQILDLLTTEELMMVLPKTTLIPRFFTIKPGKSIFLGGLARLDFLSSSDSLSARFTVFSSEDLPVTVSATEDADEVYNKLLGSTLMGVPCGGSKRLSDWPGIRSQDEILEVVGINHSTSCADVVLSSAGWISITAASETHICMRGWTPLARGISLRQPSLLPYAVKFRGKRIDHTPTYHLGHSDGKLFRGRNISGEDLRVSYQENT